MTKLFLKNSSGKILKDSSGNCFYRCLPETYTELEYLQSTGTQIIDPNYTMTSNNLIFEDTYEYAELTNSEACVGGLGGSGTGFEFGNGGTVFFNYRGGGNSAYGPISPVTNTKYVYKAVISATEYSCYINGTIGQTISFSSTILGQKVWINRYYGASHQLNGKQYLVKIYDNNVLVRYMIPAKRNSDNVLGMYDLVNNVFYTNAGTGTFTAGPRIPSEYQEVEYIQSDGNQYIDTGAPVTNDTDVDITYMLTAFNSTADMWGVTYPNHWDYSYLVRHGTNSTMVVHKGASVSQTTNSVSLNTQINIRTDTLNNKYYINGNEGNHNLVSMTSQNYNAFIFASDIGSTYSTVYYGRAKAKLYLCKMRNKGVLIRNFIPCYRKSDNVIGLYDTVNDKFYTNSGTGTFTKGGNV